ncbi:MAG: protein arginine kinase [Oscillospiraceae bacterium]
MATNKWYLGEGEQSDVVISTRIRLARNIEEYPFPHKLDTKVRIKLNEKIRDAVCDRENLTFTEMKTLTGSEMISLAEKHIISPEFASSPDGRALLLSESEDISIMLMEEDHIRLQVMKSGFSLTTAYEIANRVDNELNEKLKFAFDERLGYLTVCPTNIGTGMRASVMLHLPALTLCGQMGSLASTVSKLGLTIRGAFGEGTAPMGELYQLSNQVTLGISEKDAIENLKTITLQLAKEERNARAEIVKNIETQDEIFRAYGILKSARLLTTREFLELISKVRLGAVANILDIKTAVIDELMVSLQPASINALVGKALDSKDRDIERAKIVRERL